MMRRPPKIGEACQTDAYIKILDQLWNDFAIKTQSMVTLPCEIETCAAALLCWTVEMMPLSASPMVPDRLRVRPDDLEVCSVVLV